MRKLPALLSIIVLALLLVACSSDDDDREPTAPPIDPTRPATATETATVASVSTAVTGLATPATPGIVATPIASPVVGGTPIASPVTNGTPGAGAIAAPDGAGTPAAGMQALGGTVSLPGTINEGFVIADDGCVGLGRYAGLEAGQQVIVRDGQGAIIGVTELAATESAVVCSWTFAADVPESDYYAVSIPTVGERVYAGEDVAASDGQIELELP